MPRPSELPRLETAGESSTSSKTDQGSLQKELLHSNQPSQDAGPSGGDKRTRDQQSPTEAPPRKKMTHQEAGSKGGKIGGKSAFERGVGIHGMTPEERLEASLKNSEVMKRKADQYKATYKTDEFKITQKKRDATAKMMATLEKKNEVDLATANGTATKDAKWKKSWMD